MSTSPRTAPGCFWHLGGPFRKASLSPQGVPLGRAGKTQPRHVLSARPALCGLQPTGGAVGRKPLPPHLSLPSAAGARTSCFRWRHSDGFHRCGCCGCLVLLLARREGVARPLPLSVRFSCASSGGRRFPAPSAWAGSHGEAGSAASGRAGERLPWRGQRRAWMWPRGQAWPCAHPRVTSSAEAPADTGDTGSPAPSAEPPGLVTWLNDRSRSPM